MATQRHSRNSLRSALCGGAALAAMLVAMTPALAQGSDQGSDSLDISDTAVNAQGRVGVNAAAGVFNQQVNAGVITNGDELSYGINTVKQNLEANTVNGTSGPQEALISGDSFAGATGAIAVNGVAGVENQQANLFTIGIGIEGRTLTLEALSQTRASQEPAGSPDEPAVAKTADIGSQAFTDASGLVQVNLTAGERNSSANLFALTLTGGTD